MKPDVLIFGAGPAGLMAASELIKNNITVLIIEKEDVVGGLAKTLKYKRFLYDIGPHILPTNPNDAEFCESMYKFTKNLLGDYLIDYESIGKNYYEAVRMGKDSFTYPIQITNSLKNFGACRASHIAYDYIKVLLQLSDNHEKDDTFEKTMIKQLGRSLSDTFILKYSEKIWGEKCSNLSSDLALRVGDISISKILKGNIYNYWRNQNSSLGHQRCYPKGGIGLICERMKENIQNSDTGEFLFKSHPLKLKHDKNLIYEVTVQDNNSNQISYNPKYILSTIPIHELLSILCPKPPSEILDSMSNLKFRSHISLVLIINKTNIMREHCIYFPDQGIPFGRITEQKNFCNCMAPNKMTSLTIEFFCWNSDDLWIKKDVEIFEIAIIKLEQLGLITRDKIVDYVIHKERYAYPVYDLNYAENLRNIKRYLEQFTNIEIIGRSGAFIYMGQYRSMKMGQNKAIETVNKLSTIDRLFDVGFDQ